MNLNGNGNRPQQNRNLIYESLRFFLKVLNKKNGKKTEKRKLLRSNEFYLTIPHLVTIWKVSIGKILFTLKILKNINVWFHGFHETR